MIPTLVPAMVPTLAALMTLSALSAADPKAEAKTSGNPNAATPVMMTVATPGQAPATGPSFYVIDQVIPAFGVMPAPGLSIDNRILTQTQQALRAAGMAETWATGGTVSGDVSEAVTHALTALQRRASELGSLTTVESQSYNQSLSALSNATDYLATYGRGATAAALIAQMSGVAPVIPETPKPAVAPEMPKAVETPAVEQPKPETPKPEVKPGPELPKLEEKPAELPKLEEKPAETPKPEEKPAAPAVEAPKVEEKPAETPKMEEKPAAPAVEAPKVEEKPAEAPKPEEKPAAPAVEAPKPEEKPAEAPKPEEKPAAPAGELPAL